MKISLRSEIHMVLFMWTSKTEDMHSENTDLDI